MALNNSQFDEIMRMYNRRQLQNKAIQDERIAKVYKKVPQMKEFDDEISTLAVKRAKMLLDGDKSALDMLKAELEDLREQKELLLLNGGFPADYMKPSYTCSLCRDTGYAEGKKCSCFKQAEIALLYKQSYLEGILEKENFSVLSMEYYDENVTVGGRDPKPLPVYMREVIEECKEFVRDFSSSCQNLLFTGSAGVGKTFLTHCIARELIEQLVSVVYLTAEELFALLSNHRFKGNAEEQEGQYRMVLDCELLIIDDLGTELNNSFTNSELFYCINERILRQKATIISTNLSMNALRDTYSERVFSRIISQYRVIPLYGGDIRIQKKLMQRQ